MNRFYLTLLLAFGTLKTISVLAHYFSPSPWGGPLVLRPDRFVPDALLIEWGILLVLTVLAGGVDRVIPERVRSAWRAIAAAGFAFHALFGQLDYEVVRWLGQHMNLSYIRNFAGARDPQLAGRILSGDPWWTGFSLVLAVLGAPLATWVWIRHRAESRTLSNRALAGLLVFTILLASSPTWFRPSEKRWRRVRPATIVLLQEVIVEVSGVERPRDATTARTDLLSLVATGAVAEGSGPTILGPDPNFPLWRDSGIGALAPDEFQAQPLEQRPDVIFIVFETMRGWNTGHLPHPDLAVGTPEVLAFIENRAVVMPYMHSAGFPSVEGCMGMHLGIWSHFRKIIFSDYLHIRTRGFPEMLREAGYSTRALLGADPSFSNFTPWLERWYGDFEYTPANHHDGPLVDRFIEMHQEPVAPNTPRLMMLWTATTHPPYDIPEGSGTPTDAGSEERFDQAIRYADHHVARLLQYLASRPEWNRTVVIMLGDHAQPTPDQWRLSDRVGALTPGHTWTNFIITGGWPGLPAPTRYEGDVSHVDLAPTLLGLLNLRSQHHFMGRNLLPRLQNPDTMWPVLSFRYGDIAWLQGGSRLNFRVDSNALLRVDIDRGDALSYGLLQPDLVTPSTDAPAGWPIDRWRDAVRSYGRLLDDNALMPPAP